ncbi:MAG TPA: hypothetical protein GX503_04965 [Clostridiales bacterium]|mgnify:CR=1 FL=1|nr:hypothetical protein [Clostridiales bacterium]
MDNYVEKDPYYNPNEYFAAQYPGYGYPPWPGFGFGPGFGFSPFLGFGPFGFGPFGFGFFITPRDRRRRY